jgi:hypothetical protein
LYGFLRTPGAPAAVVMQRLSSHWIPLSEVTLTDQRHPNVSHEIWRILVLLKNRRFVHGNILPCNVMVDTRTMNDKVRLHLVNFAWSGNAQEVQYPPLLDADVYGLHRGEELILQHHDASLIWSHLLKLWGPDKCPPLAQWYALWREDQKALL